MINNVDLAGHNTFSNPDRPLDFLTCPDWLWKLMHSHVVTTNRVRLPDYMRFAKDAGLEVLEVQELLHAPPTHIQEIRPRLLRRYQTLSDAELAPIQCNFVLEKPSS
jgi:hypothetical protein